MTGQERYNIRNGEDTQTHPVPESAQEGTGAPVRGPFRFFEKWGSLFQFIKFCVVGVSNTIVSLAIYYLVVFINKDWYLAANVLGWLISVLNAFFWNNKLVFTGGDKDWKSIGRRLFRTYVAYAATMLLGTVLLHFEVQAWGISEFVAPIINLFITTPINFVTNKFWAFANRGKN